MTPLKRGDKIGIVAPGGLVPRDVLKKGISVLEGMGLNSLVGSHVFDQDKFTAGKAEDRAADINNFFSDPSIKAIIAARGGYTCNQVLPYLDYPLISKNPKYFIGLSDISVLLNAIAIKSKITTFHGPVVLMMGGGRDGRAFSDYSRQGFIETFFKSENTYKVENAKETWQVLKPGEARGRLFGGNMHSITGILGTEYEPNWKDSILFWECLDEKIGFVSQMLMHLKLRGVFEKISGMVVGKLVNVTFHGEDCTQNFVPATILDLTKAYKFPIIYGVDFGHIPDNIILPVNGKISFNTKANFLELNKE